MKKLILALLIISPAFFTAQNIKKEKIKSSFLSYPKINMTGIDVATLKAEFCTGDIKIVSQNVKKGSNACKAAGGKAQVIEIFYYQLGVMKPVSFLRISDNSGNIKYVKQTTFTKAGSIDFGKKKCYWTEGVLKSAYEKERVSFQEDSQKEEAKEAMKVAKDFLNSALSFTYVDEEIEVFFVKDKSDLYADLEKAATIASEGYASLKDNYSDNGGQAKLKEAIAIWEKAMTESTPDLKDSRINKKVTMHLAENLGFAYMHLMDFEKAQEVVKAALDLQKNVSDNGTVRRKVLLNDILSYKKAYQLNKDLPVKITTVKVPFTSKPKSEIQQFVDDNKKYGVAEAMEDAQASNEEYEKGVESGEINKYQKFVVDIAGGKMITLPDLAAKMTKTEGGEKLDEFPEEITTLSDITTLILRGNNLKSIPASIGNMTNLKKLVLTNNQLKSLPEEISELKELKTLNLKGNPIPVSEQSKIQGLLPDCKISF